MLQPKISIIVPVYKVENYLDRCIESLVNQTYKAIEIILIDDGSPDNCPQMCDEWRLKDYRIKVMHKKNGGLSDARNNGIQLATGKFLCFVDSDDWVSVRFVEELYNLLCQSKAAIAAVGYQMKYNSILQQDNSNLQVSNTVVFTMEEAISELFCDFSFCNYSWNKLYKKELFEDICFPVGKNMEDLGTTYKLILKSDKIVFNSSPLYSYFQRDDSILHKLDKKFYQDKFLLSYERYVTLSELNLCIEKNNVFMFDTLIETFPHLDKRDYTSIQIDDIIRNTEKDGLRNLSMKRKIKYFLFKFNKPLFRAFILGCGKLKL